MVTVRPPLAVPPSVTVCKRRLGQSTFCPPARWSISKMKKKILIPRIPSHSPFEHWCGDGSEPQGAWTLEAPGRPRRPGACSAGSRAWAPERARGASRAELSCLSHEQPRESNGWGGGCIAADERARRAGGEPAPGRPRRSCVPAPHQRRRGFRKDPSAHLPDRRAPGEVRSRAVRGRTRPRAVACDASFCCASRCRSSQSCVRLT